MSEKSQNADKKIARGGRLYKIGSFNLTDHSGEQVAIGYRIVTTNMSQVFDVGGNFRAH